MIRHFASRLIKLIHHYRLHERKLSQLKTHVDWKQILVMAEYGMLSEKMARNFLCLIEVDIDYLKDYPEFLHESPEAAQFYAEGKPHIKLGTLVEDPLIEFGIRLDGPVFILCAGLTGYGKTTAIRILLKGIHEYNLKNPNKRIVVIVFDRKGGDYADLPATFGWRHYHIYHTLRQALENPTGMSPQVWINILCRLFCGRASLEYAWTTQANALRTLLAQLNPQSGQRLIWPDFQLLLDFLNALPDTTYATKAEYVRSLKQQLEAICQSSFKTYNAFQGFRVEELIASGQSAVIAMPNVEPAWSRQLFVDIILSSVLNGCIERGERVDHTRILFVADECDADVNAETEKKFSDNICPFSAIFKTGREFGIGACISVSSLRSVSQLICENATYHLMFRTSDAKARAATASTLMLPPYGELTLDHLGKGQCIFKQIGPWPHAVKGQIDYMPPSRTHITKYDTHPFIPSKRLWEIPAVKDFVTQKKTAYENKKQQERKSEKASQLQELSLKLLKLRSSHPYVPVARLFEVIGKVRFERQVALRDILENQVLAKFAEIRIGRSNILLMEITDKGFEALGLPVPTERKGRGGIAHRHTVFWIKRHLEKKGYKTCIEWIIPGTTHPTDLAIPLDGGWHVYEVCITAFDNIVSHIKACFEDSNSVNHLTIVVTTKTKLNELKKSLQSDPVFALYADRISFDIVGNYIIKELNNESD